MDSKEIIRMGLTAYWDGLRKALSGLTAAERCFQPDRHANHIDFIVWHMARDEDGEVHAFAQRTSPLWQREAWYQKLGLPPEDDGLGYTVEAELARWPRQGFTAVDMETATTFAVAEYFGIARAAILDVFDNERSA